MVQAMELYPEIVQNLAYAVTALPPTPVIVEKLFSSQQIIQSDFRVSMREDLIEAMLFFRKNFFFFTSVVLHSCHYIILLVISFISFSCVLSQSIV